MIVAVADAIMKGEKTELGGGMDSHEGVRVRRWCAYCECYTPLSDDYSGLHNHTQK